MRKVEIVMAPVGDEIENLTLRWLKDDNAIVSENDILFEVESDKAAIEFPSPAGGKLQRIVRDGRFVRAGSLIGRILSD